MARCSLMSFCGINITLLCWPHHHQESTAWQSGEMECHIQRRRACSSCCWALTPQTTTPSSLWSSFQRRALSSWSFTCRCSNGPSFVARQAASQSWGGQPSHTPPPHTHTHPTGNTAYGMGCRCKFPRVFQINHLKSLPLLACIETHHLQPGMMDSPGVHKMTNGVRAYPQWHCPLAFWSKWKGIGTTCPFVCTWITGGPCNHVSSAQQCQKTWTSLTVCLCWHMQTFWIELAPYLSQCPLSLAFPDWTS